MSIDQSSVNGANRETPKTKQRKGKTAPDGTEPADQPVPDLITPPADAPTNGTEPAQAQLIPVSYRSASKASRPCPRCGGTNRFFWGSQQKRWICRAGCGYTERDSDSDLLDFEAAKREYFNPLTDEQRDFVYESYQVLARTAHKYLLSGAPDANLALKYLRDRGFTDETIERFGLGYCPANNDAFKDSVISVGMGSTMEDFSSSTGDGLVLGGLAYEQTKEARGTHHLYCAGYKFGPQVRNSICIPYGKRSDEGKITIVYLRFRMFDGDVKYLSPAGSAFAGGPPSLFNCLTLESANKRVILTEGEFKAMMAEQEGFPAVAIPGISLLIPASAPKPFSQIEQLANKEVVLCFDSEERKKPFELSPGEHWTITYAQRLLGLKAKKELDKLKKEYKPRKILFNSDGTKMVCDENKEIDEQRIEYDSSKAILEKELLRLEGLGIRLLIQQLPRKPIQPKVDLDSFLLEHGATALSHVLVEEAQIWLNKHTTTRFWYKEGGITGLVETKEGPKAREIANYAVRGLYNEEHFDGKDSVMFHHFVIQRANRSFTTVRIPNEEWRNDAKALNALRAAEGTLEANDKGAALTLEAIKTLSLWGGNLAVERVYTATGWEQIMGRWQFLAPDGAISARGFKPSPFAELDKELPNMWYGFNTPGDPRLGAKALLDHLRDPVPAVRQLGMITLAHYTLPLIHRFLRQTGRPLLFFMGKSASFKTSYATTLLGLYGKEFVEIGDTGKQSLSFEMSLPAIELSLYYMRDYMAIMDNYLPSTQRKRNSFDVENFIHLYSQGAGRTVSQNYGTSLRKTHGSRALIIITGETMPDTPGEVGRLIPLVFPKLAETVKAAKEKLKTLQIAGHDGHFSALFRDLIAWIAEQLDQRQANNPFKSGFEQEKGDFVSWLQGIMEADEALDAGHNRASKALSQNKVGFWLFLEFMTTAKYITAKERTEFETAYLAAREDLAIQLRPQNTQKTTTARFIEAIQDALAQGTHCLEPIFCQKCSDEDDATEQKILERNGIDFVCTSCNHRVEAKFVLGWKKGEFIALYPHAAYELAKSRIDGTPESSMWRLLASEGLIIPSKNRNTKNDRNPYLKGATSVTMLIFPEAVFDVPAEEVDEQVDTVPEQTNTVPEQTEDEIASLCGEIVGKDSSFVDFVNEITEKKFDSSGAEAFAAFHQRIHNDSMKRIVDSLLELYDKDTSKYGFLAFCETHTPSLVADLMSETII